MALFDTNKTNLLFSLLEELEWIACGLLLFLRRYCRSLTFYFCGLCATIIFSVLEWTYEFACTSFCLLCAYFLDAHTGFTAYFVTLCTFHMRRSISGCALYDFLIRSPSHRESTKRYIAACILLNFDSREKA